MTIHIPKVSIEGVVVGAPTPGDTPSTTLRTVQSPLTVVNRSSSPHPPISLNLKPVSPTTPVTPTLEDKVVSL
eukprot:479405-Amorphochlora_amoeboformis.AAC.1